MGNIPATFLEPNMDGHVIHRCDRCGYELKTVQDQVKVEGDRFICAFCYRQLLFPEIQEGRVDMFD